MAAMVRAYLSFLVLVIMSIAPGPSPLFLAVGSAHAAPMVELISGGDVIGDGATPVQLHVVAFNSDGTAMDGANIKVSAQAGKTGKVSMLRAGLYAVEWTPPEVSAVSDVRLSIKGKSPAREPIEKAWNIAVHPSLDSTLTATANPAELTLGRDTGTTITIVLEGARNGSMTNDDLVVSANSGTVENVTHMGGGRFAASYKPPAKFFPHVALITFADRRNPNRSYGSLAIPLVGKANFPVVGLPNSSVLVRIDDREYGPVPSDGNGRAQVPIEVRPGFVDARVVSVSNGQQTEEPLDMQVPPAERVALFPISKAIASDPLLSMPVRAFVTQPNGTPDESARVKFTTTAGTMSEATHEGRGVYMAVFTPPFGNQRAAATLTVNVDDLRGPQSASTNIDLIPARPGAVTLTPEPPTLMKTAKGFQVLTKVRSADGVGMAGKDLRFQANGAKPNGSTQDLGSGDYKTRFQTTGKGAVELIATVRSEGSSNPFRQVLLFPSRDRLPNDGLSSAMITVLTLDEYGYPVGNVPVGLSVAAGDGSIPAQVTSDSSGLAQVYFTSGRGPGLSRITAKAGDTAAMIPMLLAPDIVATTYTLPASGTTASITLYEAWRRIIQSVRLDREGMVGAPIVGYSADDSKIGPPATISAVAEPNQIAAGGTVSLRMEVKDASGRGVGGQTIVVMASPGEVSAVTDQGGGRYSANVTAPAGVAGSIKVSAVIAEAGVASTLELPIAGGGWASVGTANQGAQTAPQEPTKPKTAKKPKQPRTGSGPWLRAQAGLVSGGYHYHQEATVLRGPIVDAPISFGGAETDPARSIGFVLKSAMEVPNFEDNIGVRASFRSALYRVDLPALGFQDTISDWLNNFQVVGVGRHTLELANGIELQPGLRLGMAWDDFITFQQTDTKNTYGPLVVTALQTGPELAASWNDQVFGHIGLNFNFANFTAYYALGLDMEVAYVLRDDLFAFIGTEVSRRSLGVYRDQAGTNTQVGVVEDHFNAFNLGLGWQM